MIDSFAVNTVLFEGTSFALCCLKQSDIGEQSEVLNSRKNLGLVETFCASSPKEVMR